MTATVALEEWLKKIEASAYGTTKTALEILNALTDEQIEEVFSNLLEGLLQEGTLQV